MKFRDWLIHARVAFDEVKAAAERAFRVEDHARQYSELTQLEDRVLLSATPVAVVAAPEGDAPQQDAESSSSGTDSATEAVDSEQTAVLTDELRTDDASLALLDEASEGLLSAVDDQPTVRELVFVDEAAEDYEQLLADLTGDREDGRSLFLAVSSGRESNKSYRMVTGARDQEDPGRTTLESKTERRTP